MYPKIITLACCALLLASAQGQVSWCHAYGGNGSDQGAGVLLTGGDNAVVVGATGSFGSGSGDAYVFQVDADGFPIWTRTFGGSGVDRANAVDGLPNDDILVLGTTNSSGAGGYDGWMFALDQAGDLLWERTYGGDGWEFFHAVAVDADGIWGAGTRYGSGLSGADIWVVRTDLAGEVVWSTTVGTLREDEGRAIVPTDDGGCAVAGWTTRETGEKEPFVVKLDADGNEVWRTSITHSGTGWVNGIARCGDGSLLLTGGIRDTQEYQEILLARVASDGLVQWSRPVGQISDWEGHAIQEREDGGIVVAGWTEAFGGGGKDMYLLLSDPEGEYEFGTTFGGSEDDLATGLAIHPDGGFYLVGNIRSAGAGPISVFLVRTTDDGVALDPTIHVFSDPLSVLRPQSPRLWQPYPQPVASGATLFWNAPLERAAVLGLYDAMGRRVHGFVLPAGATSMALPNLAPGAYTAVPEGGDTGLRTRIVVEQ